MRRHSQIGRTTQREAAKRLIALAFLTGLLTACFSSSQTVSGGRTLNEERFEAIKRYWEWSAYWGIDGVDFPGAQYAPGRSFGVLVFFSLDKHLDAPFWGFCSREMSVCQAYFAWPDHTVYRSQSLRMKKAESEAEALNRFSRQHYLSDEEQAQVTAERTGPRLLVGPAGDSTNIGLGVPDSSPLQTIRHTVVLPKLGLPGAVKSKLSNTAVEALVRGLRQGDCTMTVPFADKNYPLVPVLTECPKERGIMFLRKDVDQWIATAGGWMSQPEVVERFERRIREHASMIASP